MNETARPAPAVDEATPLPGGPRQRRACILVVEDDELVRDVARRILVRNGHEVLLAEDGRQALDLFHQRGATIDLVLLDLRLPGLSGQEVLRAIRAASATVPILLATGGLEDLGEELALAQGVVRKPYRLEELERTTQAVLGPARTA